MASLLVVLLGFAAVIALLTVHEIPEGHVGIYYFGGALTDRITDPGFHFKYPLARVEHVQYTLQTDTVKEIPCGTSGGVLIYFDKIEVVNFLEKDKLFKTVKQYGVDYDKTWIFDKIHHEINQFCSSHSLQEVYIDKFDSLDEALAKSLQDQCNEWETGIQIVAIRVTKPRIPESVRKNYEAVEESKTKLRVAEQEQKIRKSEEETKSMQARIRVGMDAEIAIINAQKEASVSVIESQKIANQSKIRVEMELLEKEAEKKKSFIDAEIYLQRELAIAEASAKRIELEAEALLKKLTPEFLKYTLYVSLTNNTKIYFGEKIPQMFLDFLGPQGEKDLKIL